MGRSESNGIILRTYPLSDADRIVVALTESDGLIRGVAKGARRLKSRFGSGLEPFSIVRLSYFRKEERELVYINSTELVRSHFEVASFPEFLEAFSYASDLLQGFAAPHDPNERLYNMTRICLETASDDPEKIPQLIVYFEIWLLKLGGFLPKWEVCSGCERSLEGLNDVFVDSEFHIVCSDCEGRGTLRRISPAQLQIILKAQKTSPSRFAEDTTNGSDLEEISSSLKRLISRILNKEVRGLSMRSAS